MDSAVVEIKQSGQKITNQKGQRMTAGKRKISKVILSILLVLFTIMEGGCMKTREEYKSLSQSAIDFLEEKYNREFSLCSYEEGDYLSEIDYVHCMTEGMDPEHEGITVTVRQKDGDTIFEDNYFSYLIRPELEAYITDMIQEEFPETKVYVENHGGFLSNELTGESTFDDFYQVESGYRAVVKAYIKGNPEITEIEYEEKMKTVENRLLASGHSYTIYIFVVNPDVYNKMERYEQTDFWDFFITNRMPDGEQYYYLYHERITGGEKQYGRIE